MMANKCILFKDEPIYDRFFYSSGSIILMFNIKDQFFRSPLKDENVEIQWVYWFSMVSGE